MPEYPDITLYIERLEEILAGRVLEKVRVLSPFFLRSVKPPVSSIEGLRVEHFRRMGKRIVFSLADDYYLIIHLMIAGRLYWKKRGVAVPRKNGLAAFDFSNGSLLVIEHSSKKRASLHIIHLASSLEH